MKLFERRFRLRKFGHWQGAGDARFCSSALQDIFRIPEYVRVIWIALHDRPAANRMAGKIIKTLGFPEVFVDGDCVDATCWDRYLEPLVGRLVYIEVQYEEP